MDSQPSVRRAEKSDQDAVLAAFTAGVLDDPVTVWLLAGQPAGPLLDGYAGQLIETSLRDAEIWIAGAGAEIWTVSIWQTITSSERFRTEAEEIAARAARSPEAGPLRRSAYLTALLAREHPREFPYGYLHVIATVPQHRNRGAGAAILARRARSLTGTRTSAFLKASSEQSARLYTRHGFVRDKHTIPLPDDGPTLIPMWFRPARARSPLRRGGSW